MMRNALVASRIALWPSEVDARANRAALDRVCWRTRVNGRRPGPNARWYTL